MLNARLFSVVRLASLVLASDVAPQTTTRYPTSTTSTSPSLTTLFVVDQSCLDRLIWEQLSTESPTLWFGCREGAVASTCCPAGYFEAASKYYSPGICGGQYSACKASITNSASPKETVEICCPTHFACPVSESNTNWSDYCYSPVSNPVNATRYATDWLSSSILTISTGTVTASAFHVLHQQRNNLSSSDSNSRTQAAPLSEALGKSTSGPSAVLSGPMVTTATPTQSTGLPSSAPSIPHTGVAKGAKIGIIVGVGTAIMLVVLWFCLGIRKRTGWRPRYATSWWGREI